MSTAAGIGWQEALNKLKEGNEKFVNDDYGIGDISPKRRLSLTGGQSPFAVILSCSDSRVIPEAAFSSGLGEIFVIRVAGNVIGDHELGSIEYVTGHLGAKLVVVMGHENCGAVGAALEGAVEGFVATLTNEIKKAIGSERDPKAASIKNANYVMDLINEKLNLPEDVKVIAAFYNISDGKVDFFEE